ncbi:MAG: universal stress protein [Hymenobacter sp.]
MSTGIVHGEAAPEIVAEARRQRADLIVIGAHGQTGLTPLPDGQHGRGGGAHRTLRLRCWCGHQPA